MKLIEKRTRCIIIALITCFMPALASSAAKATPSSDKAATVNGAVISRTEVEFELSQFKRKISRQNQTIPDSQMASVRHDILDSLINKELLYQDSRRKGIQIEAADVENYVSSLKKKFAGQGEFERALKDLNISETDLRAKIKKGYAIQKLIDTYILKKLEIPDQESRRFFEDHPDIFKQPEQVKARHILIKVDPEADEKTQSEAVKKIEDIQKKIQQGEVFSSLAEQFSEGPSSTNGGDLGYFARGQMVKPFEEAAFAMNPGQVSGVVKTRFGYHLIQVVDKKPEKRMTFDETKDSIERLLTQKKMKAAMEVYIEKLKSSAAIEKYEDATPN